MYERLKQDTRSLEKIRNTSLLYSKNIVKLRVQSKVQVWKWPNVVLTLQCKISHFFLNETLPNQTGHSTTSTTTIKLFICEY